MQKIYPLDERSDCLLWLTRVLAACSAKDLETVLDLNGHIDNETSNDVASPAGAGRPDDHPSAQGGEVMLNMRKQASKISVSALGNHGHRLFWSVIGQPRKVLAMPDARYDFKTTASKMS